MPTSPHSALDPLANPLWNALLGPHRHWAEGLDDLRWYPSDIAPFIAIRSATTIPDLDTALHRGWRQPSYFLGVLPERLPAGWTLTSPSTVLQMLPEAASSTGSDELDIRELQPPHRPQMQALAQRAFPDYFRERTAVLGTYLGIFAGSELVAMAGERMELEGRKEISGVCTHPDFGGRGYARRLTNALLARHRQQGVASFLHVSESNAVARRLYESMGFRVRASLAHGKVLRDEEHVA